MHKAYINKSDPRITAEKSYSYSTHYLILNETRTVICQLPCDQIEGSGSWEEEIKEPEFKERVFTLDPDQVEKFDIWRKRKNKKKGEVYVGAIGGAYTYCFTPTGLGTITVIKCADGTELDLTYDFN